MRYRQRSPYEWAFWVLVLLGGVLVALAPVSYPGLVLGGSACGGGGSDQFCRGIARQLTLLEISPRAWLWVFGGAAIAVVAVTALLVTHEWARLGAAVVVLAVAVAGVAQTTEIEAKLGPPEGGTWGRADEDWGPFLRPALLDLRADKRRELEGKRQRPGGPAFEREQILDSFSARPRLGWRLLTVTLVVLLFASAFEVARLVLHRPSLAAVVAVTGAGVTWAILQDNATQCDPGGSDCYKGLLTLGAVLAAALAWAAYGIGVAAGRLTRPRPPRQPE